MIHYCLICIEFYPLSSYAQTNLSFIDVGLIHHNSIGALKNRYVLVSNWMQVKAAPGRDAVTTLISTGSGGRSSSGPVLH